MAYIYISVVCSVVVSVLLKLAPRFCIDIRQVIAGGYLIATLLCLALLNPSPQLLFYSPTTSSWLILVGLGILLPSIFLIMAISIDKVGIVRTDAAQRISLILPLLAAFTIFNDQFTTQKILGIIVGLIAIGCIIIKNDSKNSSHIQRINWLWPFIVFLGFGAIDILFKYMAKLTKVPFQDALFAAFILAFFISCLYLFWLWQKGRLHFKFINIFGAIAIGIFNFGNILFYIKAHQHLSKNPALVFSTMNIGVITLSAFIGLLIFKEKLNTINSIGIILAITAVAILTGA